MIAKTAQVATSAIYASAIALDGSGNVFIGGSYYGQVDVNPSTKIDSRLPNFSADDGYVAKFSSTGASRGPPRWAAVSSMDWPSMQPATRMPSARFARPSLPALANRPSRATATTMSL